MCIVLVNEYSSREVVNKLRELGELRRYKVVTEYRIRLPKIERNVAYVDCVWFTTAPVEVPVVGFEVSARGNDFSNFKKMKGDIVNLQLLRPRAGILAVNEREAESSIPTWYQAVETYKQALIRIASPIPLGIVDIHEIMTDKVYWRDLLREIG